MTAKEDTVVAIPLCIESIEGLQGAAWRRKTSIVVFSCFDVRKDRVWEERHL